MNASKSMTSTKIEPFETPLVLLLKLLSCTSTYVGWAILQYYRHYAILGYAISISQIFSHVKNIAYAIYRRISPHITGNTLCLMA